MARFERNGVQTKRCIGKWSCVVGLLMGLGLPSVEAQNQAIYLDGIDDHVEIPAAPLTSLTNGTVAMWLRPDIKGTRGMCFFGLADGTELHDYLRLQFGRGNEPHFFHSLRTTADSTYYYWLEDVLNHQVNTNTWYHYVITQSDFGPTVYIDGFPVEQTVGSPFITPRPETWFADVPNADTAAIGAMKRPSADGVTGLWEGYIDQVQIWNRSMNADEVFGLYKGELLTNDNSLVAFYDFEQGTAADVSGNGNHGTIFGGASTAQIDLPPTAELVTLAFVPRLRWFAEVGVTYQSQKRALGDAVWTDFGASFVGAGLVTNIVDDVTSGDLYRLIVVE